MMKTAMTRIQKMETDAAEIAFKNLDGAALEFQQGVLRIVMINSFQGMKLVKTETFYYMMDARINA